MKKLHVVSFTIPYPANYGGAIDVFFKLKALKNRGVDVVLHCYQYDREPSVVLNELCNEVYYYKRNMKRSQLLSGLPFIVKSRYSEDLIQNLCKDDSPILFEGIHTTLIAKDDRLTKRIKILRSHNIEHDYYRGLAKVEKQWSKKLYLSKEAKKLEKYEASILPYLDKVIAISPKDNRYFSSKKISSTFVSAFHAVNEISLPNGNSDYVLYHGSLDVGENNEAALFLVKNVFSRLKYKCIIAGRNPSNELRRLCRNSEHIELKEELTSEEILELVKEAQVNVLPTFQSTGIKLKLLIALFSGRYAVVNSPMVKDTGLESLCMIGDSADQICQLINEAFSANWNQDLETEKRKALLLKTYSNEALSEKIIESIGYSKD